MALVEIERDGSIALVRLNRPPVNALNEELANDLLAAFTECQDPKLRAVVVAGQPNFAAGADIKGFLAQMEEGSLVDRIATALVKAIQVLEELDKPTIAAVHGFALGGGLELAMGADFRYLAEDARVGQPEILLGLIPGAGGTQRLTRLVGYQTAKEMVFTGRQVRASEALDLGLADKVVPDAQLLDVAMEDAAEWANKATLGLAEAKRVLRETGVSGDFASDLRLENKAFLRLFASRDAREGVAAFIEKRPPEFKAE